MITRQKWQNFDPNIKDSKALDGFSGRVSVLREWVNFVIERCQPEGEVLNVGEVSASCVIPEPFRAWLLTAMLDLGSRLEGRRR
jgi:hypothetical protein